MKSPVESRHIRNAGCGCRQGKADERTTTPCEEKLLEQIRAIDFALYEVILYLDVYPNSCDALETYHKLLDQQKVLYREYQETYGPLTAFGNESKTSWDWMKNPAPWEYSAD